MPPPPDSNSRRRPYEINRWLSVRGGKNNNVDGVVFSRSSLLGTSAIRTLLAKNDRQNNLNLSTNERDRYFWKPIKIKNKNKKFIIMYYLIQFNSDVIFQQFLVRCRINTYIDLRIQYYFYNVVIRSRFDSRIVENNNNRSNTSLTIFFHIFMTCTHIKIAFLYIIL